MSLRKGMSNRLAAALLARCQRRTDSDGPLTIRPSVWRKIPRPVRDWFEYRVLAELERKAFAELQSHELLGRFATEFEHNRWAMSPAAFLHIWKLLEREKPTRIVEFGSGLSTRVLAEYARRAGATGQSVSLLSIEHDDHWLMETRDALARDHAEEFVEFCHAPIGPQRLLGRTLDGYLVERAALDRAAGDTGFNFCLIDGPPGRIGRAGCLPLVAPFLADKAIVLLDDALRTSELNANREWRRHLGRHYSDAVLNLIDRHGLLQAHWKGSDLSQGSSDDLRDNASGTNDKRSKQAEIGSMNGLS